MDWKKLGKKLCFPPLWLTAILTLLSTGSLIVVFTKGLEQTVPAYIVYVLAFYTLCTITAFCVLALPKRWGAIKEKIYASPWGNRFMTDRAFRTGLALSVSFAVSMLYVAVNLWFYHMLRSWWFVVLAVYYVIMAVMRYLLVRYVRIQKIGTSILGEWRRSRSCACILLLINLSLSGAVLMILYQNKGYAYPGMMIYVMALYTFYSAIHTVVDLVKYRKLGSPIMSTAKTVSLCGALVSVLNLETAMFAQFGADMSPESQHMFIILTGAGVSITVVTLSVILITKANKEIRRIKNGE